MASQAGIGPATSGLGIPRSVQLSYWDAVSHLSAFIFPAIRKRIRYPIRSMTASSSSGAEDDWFLILLSLSSILTLICSQGSDDENTLIGSRALFPYFLFLSRSMAFTASHSDSISLEVCSGFMREVAQIIF